MASVFFIYKAEYINNRVREEFELYVLWVDKNQRVGVVILMFRAFHFLNLYSDKVCAPFRGRRACSLLHIFSEYQIRLISCTFLNSSVKEM